MSRIGGISGFEDLTITADGNDAVIDLSDHGAGTIRLQNTSVDDLDATDFLFDLPPASVEDGGWTELGSTLLLQQEVGKNYIPSVDWSTGGGSWNTKSTPPSCET